MTGLSLYVPPFFMETAEDFTVMPVAATAFFCTFTFSDAFLPLFSLTVTVAVPVFLPAVILPLLLTFTIFLLLLLHEAMLSPRARPLAFTFVVDWPFFSRMLLALSLTVGFSLSVDLYFTSPHTVQRDCCFPFLKTVAFDTVSQDP